MAIQNRRGSFSDFDRTKLLSGEFAFVVDGDADNSIDGKSIYAKVGDAVKQLATHEDIVIAINNAIEDVRNQIVNEAVSLITNGPVLSFNGRNGAVVPKSGDYYADMIRKSTGSTETVAQAINNLDASISASWKLLKTFTNASFSANSVLVTPGIENYKVIAIAHQAAGTANSNWVSAASVDLAYREATGTTSKLATMEEVQVGSATSSPQMITAFRQFSFDNTGVTLQGGWISRIGSTTSAAVENDYVCVPIAIYGVC